MASSGLGFHSTFTDWIDRQEVGKSGAVVGQGRAIVQDQDKMSTGVWMFPGPA